MNRVDVIDLMMEEPVALAVEANDEERDGDVIAIIDEADVMVMNIVENAAFTQSSPLLLDMCKMGYTCKSILLSGEHDSCTKIVEQCRATPEQAMHQEVVTRRTPLHEICLRNGCLHVVSAILQANPLAALARDVHGNTPLHLLFTSHKHGSILSSCEQVTCIVQTLLQHEPQSLLTATNVEGNTPLHILCAAEPKYASCAILETLLEHDNIAAAARNEKQQVPLHIYTQQPCTRTNIDFMKLLLQPHADASHLVDASFQTPLHYAARLKNVALVCCLVEHGDNVAAMIFSRQGPLQQTPLQVLCLQKPRIEHLPALQAMMHAAPEAMKLVDSHGRTPLHALLQNKRPCLQAICMLLEMNENIARKTDTILGYTALHYACEFQASHEVIATLVAACPQAAQVASSKGDTALHLACTANACPETVELLVTTFPDALTMQNAYGFTPLHAVCRARLPRLPIVQLLCRKCPSSVAMQSHGGETPMHLACSSGAHVKVLELLAAASPSNNGNLLEQNPAYLTRNVQMTNKIGNTPLHEACFRGAGHDRIEALCRSNPEWIMARNNAGYTPLQVLCKGGQLDDVIVQTFSRIGGPQVFAVVDDTGHTPLHSASRDGTDVDAIQSLIRAYPQALHLKTIYGDTPLHLSILRRASVHVVRLIAEASMERRAGPLLEQNASGQTPMSIAMDAFQSTCPGRGGCCVQLQADQDDMFHVLALLVKLLYYGHRCVNEQESNLVRACVSLHRQDVRLDPAFIRRAIAQYPQEVQTVDSQGNYPLHIEAGIPVEKMTLLDSSVTGCCGGKCHTRSGILEILLKAHPTALCVRNSADEFPLGLMIRNGRSWSKAFALALRTFPSALQWYHGGIHDGLYSFILERVSKHCGPDTLYQLLLSQPTIVAQTRR